MRIGTSFSICLTDIPKDKIQTGKNGKKYLNLNQYVDTEEESQYGTHGSITVAQSQEEREAKAPKVYLGNAKVYYNSEAGKVAQSTQPNTPDFNQQFDDDLDF